MKKSFSALFSLLFTTSIVSAQTAFASGLGLGMQQLIDMVEQMLTPFFTVILGGSGGMLFERILFLVIILAIVYIITSRMPVFQENVWVIWIVSISISLLSTRFLIESNLIQTMLLPYSAFGIAVSAALPILIYFTFVESFSSSATTRKMLWIFYIITFIGIWNSRYNEVGALSWIYLASAGAALIFLLFDGTIRRAIVKQQMKALNTDNKEEFMIKIRKQLAELHRNYTDGYMSEARYKKINKRLNKQLETIMKN